MPGALRWITTRIGIQKWRSKGLHGNCVMGDRESRAGDLAVLCAMRLPPRARLQRQEDHRTGPGAGALVRQMFEWYSSGRYSVREITRMARAAGLAFRKTGKRLAACCFCDGSGSPGACSHSA